MHHSPAPWPLDTVDRDTRQPVGSGVVVCVNPVRFQVLFDPADDVAPWVPVLFPLSQRVASGHLGYAVAVVLGGGRRGALQPPSAETINRAAEEAAG